MSSSGDGDRHREHLGVSQTKHAKKKKSRRPIDPEDIAGYISSASERISHDTHIFVVPFGTADPRQYYPNYGRSFGASSTSQALLPRRYEDLPLQAIHRARPLSVGTPSPTGTSPQLSTMKIGDSSSEQSDAMVGTPPLTQRFVHPNVSPSSRPSSTPDDEMPVLDPGQNDRLDKFKAMSEQAKKDRGNLKGGSLHTGGAKSVGTIARQMFLFIEKRIGTHSHGTEGFKKTHVRKKENESDQNVWVEKRAERTFNEFHQYVVENLVSSVEMTPEMSTQIWKEKVVGGTHKGRVYVLGSRNDITAMSTQIARLISALAESERNRVAQQQSMSESIQQIKEQVMNLAHRPTTLAPKDTDDDNDEDDYVDPTP
ncbi:hypothetical protein MTR67_012132 [Solanum verrucosum]|uniref:Uncharacterized protein n=1 Tax=Solanum verrucosum TaxID=315347 RepID=A0AAF0Q838_SOLVR|nr:hypothetical protein MTR67_012132 [Solanum verrucosum]